MPKAKKPRTQLAAPEPRDLLTREAVIQTRAEGMPDRAVDVVASTATLDSWGTVLKQDSWDLSGYARNPVVLYGHDRWDLPVGRAEDVRVEDGELRARLVFASAEANPRAEQVWQSIREGTLRAISVGFYASEAMPGKVDDEECMVLSGLELLEISVVPLGANPDAMAKLKARARAHGGDMEFRQAVLAALGVEGEAEALGVLATLAPLKARCETAEAEVQRLVAEAAKTRAAQEAQERATLLLDAQRDGRVTPAMLKAEGYAASLDALSLPALRANLGALPKRHAPAAVPATDGEGSALSDDELKFSRMAGLTVQEYRAARAAAGV